MNKTVVLLEGPDDGLVLDALWPESYGRDYGIEWWGGGQREHEPHLYLFSFEENGVRYYLHESEAKID